MIIFLINFFIKLGVCNCATLLNYLIIITPNYLICPYIDILGENRLLLVYSNVVKTALLMLKSTNFSPRLFSAGNKSDKHNKC